MKKRSPESTRLAWAPTGRTDIKTMQDLLTCLMANIEDGLIQSGAEPNVDYNFRDLLQAAMPMVADSFNKELCEITVQWQPPLK